ncbi:mediator complex subunit MED7 [Spizellomyces punctatus DAOM BR117]|uniref:Mediator of RNA polymerase II transcription subunit 7 n=1 Tax=Spizellomyces punctatus (strain DAOM BR117) TaxID=645134 RepID=A0A0L0HIU1_SPIPD|nr:hypothetical protein, variant [Spizellomyces punctatus DAOM BR117]XP_016608784.1 mediator complex subunit MED7 [Spizellomyces punctatus DAOM BR117]KND00744.1 hypothetical protein, variant [Spizellomyces punctatus DAOM BR117]KND00745.1 hypothetical protein SPPG_03860 [Spizellomyces punctatus DAOM BR117]|eukprot:XP_016608783.1 hypothetical protein, variant [Spizellomyces punctatus DAOM BR117]
MANTTTDGPGGITVTAYPLPPSYFKLYTDANVSRFPEYQAHKGDKEPPQSLSASPGVENLNQEDPPSLPNVESPFLHPPIPLEGPYQAFGATYSTDDALKPLSEDGVKQLYPDGPIDWKSVMKNLVRTLVLNLTELAQVMAVRGPLQSGYKLEQIDQIMANIHHLINQYRSHQVRDTVRLMLEKQINRRREMAQQIRRCCNEMREELQQAKKEVLNPNLGDAMTVDGEEDNHMGTDQINVSDNDNLFEALRLLQPRDPLQRYNETQQRLAALADSIE